MNLSIFACIDTYPNWAPDILYLKATGEDQSFCSVTSSPQCNSWCNVLPRRTSKTFKPSLLRMMPSQPRYGGSLLQRLNHCNRSFSVSYTSAYSVQDCSLETENTIPAAPFVSSQPLVSFPWRYNASTNLQHPVWKNCSPLQSSNLGSNDYRQGRAG